MRDTTRGMECSGSNVKMVYISTVEVKNTIEKLINIGSSVTLKKILQFIKYDCTNITKTHIISIETLRDISG